MKQIRLLTAQDSILLNDFINSNSMIQSSEFLTKSWNYYKKLLLNQVKEFAISSIIVDHKIQGIILGYTFNTRWNKENILPFWVGSQLISCNNQKLNELDKDQMISILVEYFESLNFNVCYVVILANKKSRLIDYSSVNKYIRRSFKNLRYTFTVESIIDQQANFNSMCKMYKLICPPEYDSETHIIITRGIKIKEASNVFSYIK